MTTSLSAHDALVSRLTAYNILRQLFVEEPTVPLLKLLQQEGLLIFAQIHPSPEVTYIVNEMNAYLAGSTFEPHQEAFENLHWDFTQLFVGPEAPTAPPWESYYVRKDQLLFQETTKSVVEIYQKHGFGIDEKAFEAADHIGLELDFLFQLNLLVIEHLQANPTDQLFVQNSLKLQHHFLTEHPLRFCSQLAQKMQDGAQTKFYQQLGFLLAHFLTHDEKWLQQQSI